MGNACVPKTKEPIESQLAKKYSKQRAKRFEVYANTIPINK